MYGVRAGQQPVLTAAADYLGLSLTQLRTQLHAGKSLADIATARGKPVAGLKDAILAAMTSRVNANTALTAQQKAALISQVKSHLDIMINTDMDMDMAWATGPARPGLAHGRDRITDGRDVAVSRTGAVHVIETSTTPSRARRPPPAATKR